MRFVRNLALLSGGLLLLYFGTVTLLTVLYQWVNPPISTLMVWRALHGTKIVPPRPLPYAKIPSSVKRGVVFLEDHRFWEHNGIVLEAIQEAYEANVRKGRIANGGSTITQQLARTLFLIPDRFFIRKGLEAGTALILEAVLTKERILELYLNNIEWGPGVFGVEAGARYQYGTGVRNLSTEQLARLQAIITNPLLFTVKTYGKNRGMAARYEALMNR